MLLSHFPYEGDHDGREDRYQQWRLRDEGAWLINGHVHGAWTLRNRQINVGVDKWLFPIEQGVMASLIDGFESLGVNYAPAQQVSL